MKKRDPVILWKIRCFNKETRKFFDRLLLLDTSKVTDQEKKTIVDIAQRRPHDRRVLAYRSRFVDVERAEAYRLARYADLVSGVSPLDYFEDEQGNPMGPVELMQAISGDLHPLIAGYPQSVLRLGPAAMRAKDQWSQKTANVIGRFLQIVERIKGSDWLSSPLRLKSSVYKGRAEPVLELVHPGPETTTSVLTWIRQLYSADKALSKACQAYVRHAADERKRWWVRERREAFNKFLNERGGLLMPAGYNAREVIDAFIYGFGYFHPRSKEGAEQRLAELLRGYGRERAVMAFSMCCRDLCGYALDLGAIIKQDFDHWVKNQACAGPDWPRIEDLLGPYGAGRP